MGNILLVRSRSPERLQSNTILRLLCIQRWDPHSRLLEDLEDLEPFADILWFLRMNPMVATFEFVNWQLRDEEE